MSHSCWDVKAKGMDGKLVGKEIKGMDEARKERSRGVVFPLSSSVIRQKVYEPSRSRAFFFGQVQARMLP